MADSKTCNYLQLLYNGLETFYTVISPHIGIHSYTFLRFTFPSSGSLTGFRVLLSLPTQPETSFCGLFEFLKKR
jgi:hypothetical protein